MPKLGRALRVLVVDDVEEFGESLGSVLASVGCTVDVATTPFAGITYSDGVRYDLVLADFRMPGMDGVGLGRAISRRGHRCMLLVTGHPTDVDPEEARKAGFAGVLQKPLDVSRLLEIVRFISQQAGTAEVALPERLLEMRQLPRLSPAPL